MARVLSGSLNGSLPHIQALNEHHSAWEASPIAGRIFPSPVVFLCHDLLQGNLCLLPIKNATSSVSLAKL